MSDRSTIQWTDATWNPITGCTKVSPGCAHCYIERTPAFRMNGRRFLRGHLPLEFHDDRLDQPLHWKTPRRVFVNSLSDLFHTDVPDDFLHRVYHTMEYAKQHQFQILTKRADRLVSYLAWRYGDGRLPSRHLWHGVSVENRTTKPRIDAIREARSAVRFLSLEPLLEDLGHLDLRGISWVIVGGESGPSARPFNLEWARSIIAECRAAGVACFVKQVGSRPTGYWTNTLGPGFNRHALRDRKGGNPAEWPPDLRVREYPSGLRA